MPGTIRPHIMAVADRYAVHYEPTPDDALAEIATRLGLGVWLTARSGPSGKTFRHWSRTPR